MIDKRYIGDHKTINLIIFLSLLLSVLIMIIFVLIIRTVRKSVTEYNKHCTLGRVVMV